MILFWNWKWNRDFTFAARGGVRMYVLYVTSYSIIIREQETEREAVGGCFFFFFSFFHSFPVNASSHPKGRPALPGPAPKVDEGGTPLPPPSYPLLQTLPPSFPPAPGELSVRSRGIWDRDILLPCEIERPPPSKFFLWNNDQNFRHFLYFPCFRRKAGQTGGGGSGEGWSFLSV